MASAFSLDSSPVVSDFMVPVPTNLWIQKNAINNNLVFFLDVLSIGKNGELETHTITVRRSLYDLKYNSMNLGALVFDVLVLRIIMSSWWNFPFVSI